MKLPSDLRIYFVNAEHRKYFHLFSDEHFSTLYNHPHIYKFKPDIDTLDKIDMWDMERYYLCLK